MCEIGVRHRSYDAQRVYVNIELSLSRCSADVLGEKRTLLHSNHGVIICAETMWQAFDYLYYLERAAEVVVKARSTGMPLRVLSDEVNCLSSDHNPLAPVCTLLHVTL